MSDQLLATHLTVSNLVAGSSVTVAHGLKANGKAVAPTQVICDRASPIAVTASTTTSVTFTNLGAVMASASFRAEYDHSIHAVGTPALKWQGYVYPGSLAYGSFSDTTDQSLTTNVPLDVKYNTTDFSSGVSVSNDPMSLRPSQLTVSMAGLYSFDLAPQMFHSGGTMATVFFWAKVNGVDVPRSGRTFELGNNNNQTSPFLCVDLRLNAGDVFQWYVKSVGANTVLNQTPAVVGPPTVAEVPSVVAHVKWIAV